jgi:tripartite-type tricarboxylate transporter receptor subunit TctC
MTDMSSRITATVLQEALDQSVNVVNRTGGGGVVGHLALSGAQADGYTIGAVTVEISMLHHMGLTDLDYKNYTPLALLINNAAAITVRADAPWNTLDELIAAIKANPGSLKASGTARGGVWDLARLGFLKAIGEAPSSMPWVPSQGAAPALQELLAEGVDVVTASLSEVDALRQAGQVKTLGVMSEERLERFPDVPTLKEQGYDWSIGGWVSVCAPAGISEDVKSTLISALRTATQNPDFTTALKNAGSTIQLKFGEELETFMARQDQVNGELMREAGIAK